MKHLERLFFGIFLVIALIGMIGLFYVAVFTLISAIAIAFGIITVSWQFVAPFCFFLLLLAYFLGFQLELFDEKKGKWSGNEKQ